MLRERWSLLMACQNLRRDHSLETFDSFLFSLNSLNTYLLQTMIDTSNHFLLICLSKCIGNDLSDVWKLILLQLSEKFFLETAFDHREYRFNPIELRTIRNVEDGVDFKCLHRFN